MYSHQIQKLIAKHACSKSLLYNLSYEIIEEIHKLETHTTVVETPYGRVRNIDTGIFTGRSPKDKYFVDSGKTIWAPPNKCMSPEIFSKLFKKCLNHMTELPRLYVFVGFCGHGKHRRKVRFITEYVWQHHFVKNMFIEKYGGEIAEDVYDTYDVPDFTIINACNVVNNDWKEQGLHSEVFVVLNVDDNVGIIGGTHYGGEMKKGIFTLMNYVLPQEGVLSMHCSANVGEKEDVALFFGLSGTGKTTLSTTHNRRLIGDDEHGWDDKGIFNIEGGCYAKTIHLDEKSEPEIVQAIRKNALLENVIVDNQNHPDYDDCTKTQNGRVSYPLRHLPHVYETQHGGHPQHVIFLTCDAFGVLPPISKLTYEQAAYHYLSGYTAKVAGTERGVDEPTATFSAGFGEAFLALHPKVYADLLMEKLKKHGSQVWLVNTGWSGGGYGVGKRISIQGSRACVDGIMNNTIREFVDFPYFGLSIPKDVPGIDGKLLNPENTWSDKNKYHKTIKHLESLFEQNYARYLLPNSNL